MPSIAITCRLRRGAEPAAAALAAAAEELHGVGDDLDRLALRAVLRVPLAPLEPAVDCDGTTLGEVLRARFALVPPHGDVEVVRLLRPLARVVLAARVDREAEAADGSPGWGVAKLGVAGQVADEHDAVDVGHGFSLLSDGSETQATRRPRRCHRLSAT